MLVKTDGSLAVLDKLEVQVDPEQLSKGSVVLVAQLLRLLMAFIGENLTLQLVRDIWPKLSANYQELDEGVNARQELPSLRNMHYPVLIVQEAQPDANCYYNTVDIAARAGLVIGIAHTHP